MFILGGSETRLPLSIYNALLTDEGVYYVVVQRQGILIMGKLAAAAHRRRGVGGLSLVYDRVD